MDLQAKHIGFVLAAYAVSFLSVLALIVAVWWRGRRIARRLEELERMGAPRRRKMTAVSGQDSESEQKELTA